MSEVEDINVWQAQRPIEQGEADTSDLYVPGGFLAAINSVAITVAQIRAAIDLMSRLPVRSTADILEHGRLLAAYAEQNAIEPANYAGLVLHARAIAMDRWCDRYDPFGQNDVDAFFEAGARAMLVESDKGMAFEPAAFTELVQFTAEIPY